MKKNQFFLFLVFILAFGLFYPISAYVNTINNRANYEETNKKNLEIAYKSKKTADSLGSKYIQNYNYANSRAYTITGDVPLIDSDIKPWHLTAFAGTYTAFMVFQHVLQKNTIWKEQTSFRVMEDGKYALWADKAGHFYGTYIMAYYCKEGFLASGLSLEAATVWGSIMGLSYNTYVEILDGYGKNWGFSPSDFYADIAGAAFLSAQHYVPFLQNFTPKFTYVPAEWHGEKRRLEADMFIDDYSSHTMWMSINVHNLLPDSYKKYWPSWLAIAVGYAARNLCSPNTPGCKECGRSAQVSDVAWGNQKYIVALDYDLTQLLPDGGNFWNWLRQSLNYFKLPSPAIEFGDRPRFFLLYPFPL